MSHARQSETPAVHARTILDFECGPVSAALSLRHKDLPNLLHAHIGNSLQTAGNVRMRELLDGAPQLKVRDLDQIAALPLGSRVHLDPWSDKLELTKSNRVPLVLPREKMSFEVTPVYPYVTRMEGPDEKGKVVSEPPVK